MLTQAEIASTAVGDKTVCDWDTLWVEVPNALRASQPRLRDTVGLIRVKMSTKIMYIFRATEHGKGGVEKALQRIRGKPQTGNAAYGAQMLRENKDVLTVEVLRVGKDRHAAEITKKLKPLMIKFHDPDWNRPATNHIAGLRAGKLK